ncbi:MAG: hypothetical protein AAFX40_00335 [Cyanobacteria bacterium J06639_1]
MRSDLQNLEISTRELNELSGVSVERVLRPAVAQACSSPFGFVRWLAGSGWWWLQHRLTHIPIPRNYRSGLLLDRSRLVRNGLQALIACFILNLILPGSDWFGPLVIVALALGCFSYWVKLQDKILADASLAALLEDVEQHNSLLRAIDVNDQLRAVVEQNAEEGDRDRTLKALQINREDLLRAFKLERILRENRDIVATNPGMFATNLQSVQALRVSDRSSEYGILLEESLQLALSIQEEMDNMRNRHSLTD